MGRLRDAPALVERYFPAFSCKCFSAKSEMYAESVRRSSSASFCSSALTFDDSRIVTTSVRAFMVVNVCACAR
jgi:hypothetical protein